MIVREYINFYGGDFLNAFLEPYEGVIGDMVSVGVDKIGPQNENKNELQELSKCVGEKVKGFLDDLQSHVEMIPMHIINIAAESAVLLNDMPNHYFVSHFLIKKWILPHLLKPKRAPAANRAIIIFAKLLLNAANGVLFSPRRDYYFTYLNSYTEECIPKIHSFANQIIEFDAKKIKKPNNITIDCEWVMNEILREIPLLTKFITFAEEGDSLTS